MVNNLKKISFSKQDKFEFKNDSNVMSVGFFDGLHPVHKSILKKTKEVAQEFNYSSSVFTFEKKIGKNLVQLFSNETKYEKINSEFKIDYIFEMAVNDLTMKTTYAEFLDYIADVLKVKKVVVGSDIKFGYKAQGNLDSLIDKFGKENVIIFEREKETSSTKARELIQSGNFEEFEKLMGYRFEVQFIGQSDNTFKLDSEMYLLNGVYQVKINNKLSEITIINGVIEGCIESTLVTIIKLIKEI